MKELEKTKRLSIAATLTILVVLIGVLSFKRPKNVYEYNTAESLDKILTENMFVSLDSISNPNYVLIDVRDGFEFNKGHLENALNVPTSTLLKEDVISIFKDLKETNKTVVFYGATPQDAIAPYMVLYQLGYTNLRVLPIENSYSQNNLVTKTVEVEKYANDINGFIAESVKKAAVVEKPKPVVKPQPKKVVTIEKKKKAPAEGGC